VLEACCPVLVLTGWSLLVGGLPKYSPRAFARGCGGRPAQALLARLGQKLQQCRWRGSSCGMDNIPWEPLFGKSLIDVLEEQSQRYRSEPLVIVDGEPLSYSDLCERSRFASKGFASIAGVRKGTPVGIFMGTSVDWVVSWFALMRIGALVVPLNTALRGSFLSHQLHQAGVEVLLVDEPRLGVLSEQLGALSALRLLVIRSTALDNPDSGLSAFESKGKQSIELSSVLGPLGDISGSRASGRPQWWEVAGAFSTSGTTGPSKAVLVSHEYLLAAAKAMVDVWQLQPGERVFGPLPLFHFSGVLTVLGPLVAGGTGVLESSFSPSRSWERVRKYNAVGILLAGPMAQMLWNLPEDPSESELPIRFLSAAPIAKSLFHRIEERYQCKVVTVYGMTEAFPMTVSGMLDAGVPGASGHATEWFEVAIMDEHDCQVAPGVPGEIVCRPRRPGVMFNGYLARPDATVEATSNLWFHTGDIGYLDEYGNLFYLDRKKDAIRRRGENISSFELEQAVLEHPLVAEAAAFGVPSELGEDEVAVAVVPKAGSAPLEPESLVEFLLARVPRFAVPRYIEVRDSLPKNAVGRVLKDELRSGDAVSRSWDREAGH
jgi:crotonobetaine/carnitine-CoA ligase